VADDVSIRVADVEDVGEFIDDEHLRRRFLDHIVSRRGILLFAFRGSVFVGHIFVRRVSAEEPALRRGLYKVPLLQHLRVIDEHQRSGIGRQLIREAEQCLRALGHRSVALGVHPNNAVAIRLYRRLSFRRWHKHTLTTFRESVLDDNSTLREEEPCLVFVKRLNKGRR
jgi:ribosomal protein S18 acetylase RimI-like enzyme